MGQWSVREILKPQMHFVLIHSAELNYMQTCWTVGYVVGQIPSNLILTRVRPSIWIPSLEVTWSLLTFCLSRCNTAEQIYGVRFIVGLAESTPNPPTLDDSPDKTCRWILSWHASMPNLSYDLGDNCLASFLLTYIYSTLSEVGTARMSLESEAVSFIPPVPSPPW